MGKNEKFLITCRWMVGLYKMIWELKYFNWMFYSNIGSDINIVEAEVGLNHARQAL